MKFIGITGGAGAGKSKILRYIEQEYPAKIVLADELAHEIMQPPCASSSSLASINNSSCTCKINLDFSPLFARRSWTRIIAILRRL